MKKLFPALLLGLASRSALAIAPPTVPTAIDAMGLHLTLDYEARQLVQAKVNSLCRHQASLEARIALAESAFPLIDRVLAEEGVPADFRYLVLQESALNGNAESKHGAVGYWQFKRETALDYGLTVDRQVDERRHLTASTRAAARYLARSNNSLHNWVNTLLSYNLGLSGVQPYARPADADAARMSITASSSVYILDFIAQKVVFEPACAQHTVPFTPWREVPATPGLSLAQQAAAFAADPAAVARLNPWLLASKVPTNGRAYTLLMPLNGTATPPPLLATSPVARRGQRPAPAPVAAATAFVQVNGLRAIVAQAGDTPASLAARGGASLGFFMKVNELSRNELLIPGSPYFFERKREAAEQEYHIVRPGQSLTAIAQHFGVLRHALLAYNHLHMGEAVQPGLVLWLAHVRPRNVAAEYRALPGSRPAPTVAVQRPIVPAPEPVEEDAIEEEEQAEEIAAINELPTEVPGAPVLALPSTPARPVAVPGASAPAVVLAPAPRPVVVVRPARPVAPVAAVPVASPPSARLAAASTYTVAPRETLYSVARRFGVRPAELAAWNSLSPTAALQVGQVLRVGGSAAPATPPAPAASPAETYYAHTVAVGDTFFNISRRYGCSVAELQASNSRAEPSLRVGEVLRVPIH